MEKVFGTTVRQDGMQKVGRKNYTLFYGLYTNDSGSSYEYRHTFDHQPTWGEVKAQLIEAINEHTREEIINGFEWEGQKIWLSEQVQMNLHSIEGAKFPEGQYPINIKVNEDEDGEAIDMAFDNAEAFSVFHKAACEHVVTTLNSGWNEKKALKKSDFGFTD